MNARPYQRDCISGVQAQLEKHFSTLLVMPTGTGKSITVAHLIKESPEGRIMVLAHRQILIHQMAEKIEKAVGESVAIEMADNWSDESFGLLGDNKARVIVSTIQTQLSGVRGEGRMTRFNPHEFSRLIIDESHRSVAESYHRIIEYYRQNKNLKLIGATATPDRADEQALGQVYESVAYKYELMKAIEDGWLVPIEQRQVFVESLDFSKVRTTEGDLNGSDLATVMEYEKNLHRVADPLFELAKGRPTVVFASSVAHAERLSEILNRHQFGCAEYITAKTQYETRQDILDRLREGRLNFIVNVGCLTEGWDEPCISVVAMARPTKSRALYEQMAGRGFRPLTGLVDGLATSEERCKAIVQSQKPFVEIIDFVGNAGKHSLIGTADILGGKFSDAAVARAKKIMADGQKKNTIDALRQAQRELEIEIQKAAHKRQHVIAKATYRTTKVSPFDTLGITPVPHTPDKKLVSNDQKRFLLSQGVKNVELLTHAAACQLIGEIIKRRKDGRCTYKQAEVLKRYNYDPNTSFEDAQRLMDALAKNGWQPLSAPLVAGDGCSEVITDYVEAPF